MRIGIYSPFYHPFEGGAERVARRVAGYLARSHEVVVYTLRYDDALPTEERDGEVLIRRFPYRQQRVLGLSRIVAPALLDALRRDSVDLLQLHGVIFTDLAALVVRGMRRRGIPTLVITHGLVEAYCGDQMSGRRRQIASVAAVRPLLAWLFRAVSCVGLLSRSEMPILRALGVSERRARVLYNGYQEPVCGEAAGAAFRRRLELGAELLVLHVASVKPNKGHHLMVDAVRELRARGRAVRYAAAGTIGGLWADYAADVRRQIEGQGLGDDVTLLGHLSDDELAAAYQAADVVVLPSLAETFPLAALDAMAWGKALVATDCGGVREMVIPERTGLLVAPGRADELAEALNRLVVDAGLRARLGARAAAFVHERFSWESVLQRYERLCYQLVGRSGLATGGGVADEPPAMIAGRWVEEQAGAGWERPVDLQAG